MEVAHRFTAWKMKSTFNFKFEEGMKPPLLAVSNHQIALTLAYHNSLQREFKDFYPATM